MYIVHTHYAHGTSEVGFLLSSVAYHHSVIENLHVLLEHDIDCAALLHAFRNLPVAETGEYENIERGQLPDGIFTVRVRDDTV